MSLMIPSTRRVRTWRTDKPPSATLWPRHLRCTQFFFHILDLLARCSCSKACFNNKCMPYEMMSVLVRVAREVLRDSVWGVLLRLYLQHPGMPKKCSFVKLQKILLFLRKMPFCKKKKVLCDFEWVLRPSFGPILDLDLPDLRRDVRQWIVPRLPVMAGKTDQPWA